VVDRQFADASLAEWYDLFCAWPGRGDFTFYFPLVMSARSVLDAGCGTGLLLRRARQAGHPGRLHGLDPAAAMLDIARKQPGIDWTEGDLGAVTWDREFDLIIMTGHAFQVLLTDEEIHTALTTVRAALTPDGLFAFETRNPAAREWENWTPGNAREVTNPSGTTMRVAHQVLSVNEDRVHFSATYTMPAWSEPKISHSTLRFPDAAQVGTFLTTAGLTITAQYGDWDRTPLTASSPEIITLARSS
jgi:SAM-dependent methyltransferase